jgi:amino-acid N-acetyltransferase
MIDANALCVEKADVVELAKALVEANLPIADIAEPGRRFFRVSHTDTTIGFAGIEGDGPDQLLRSFVIVAEHRRVGLGSAMLALIEQEARAGAVMRLHLLTTSAAPFFAKHGYAPADRAAAPAAIAKSREFAGICPASAAYLIKPLGR